MNYKEAIEKLHSKNIFYVDLSLERIRLALEKLGNPQDSLKYIHVAGTNGKGSTCAMLDSILQEAGYKVGLYTSPHIFSYTERIKINGINILEEDFASIFTEINSLNIQLTEFEIITIIMFLYFSKNNVDIVVLETGMGGRFDATNVIKENLCSIITQIDLDHTDRLGKTKDEIAFEKAGIIKPKCPVITSMGYEEIRDRADELDSLLLFTSPFVPQEFVEALSLKGIHQAENLALAITAINYLFKEIDDTTIKKALMKVKNPCRFEYFPEKNLIIDASHNPNGIKALKDNLDYFYPNISRRYIFGCLKNKDYKTMMNILFEKDDEVYFYEFNHPQSCSFNELQLSCPINSKKYQHEQFSADKLNIICGSFYMISDLIKK